MTRRRPWAAMATVALLLAAPTPGPAHEIRPAYLELRELSPGEFHVLWKTPMRGDARLALSPRFSARTEPLSEVSSRRSDAAAVQVWRMRAIDPLRGSSLRIDGLDATMTDALVRAEFADGTTWVRRITPSSPEVSIPGEPNRAEVALTYLQLGVAHILAGTDHLLFVFALLLLLDVPGDPRRRYGALVRTITAFTAAHSITLGLATLGVVHVASSPVEASIALSIVFVAGEILRESAPPKAAEVKRLAPWTVAFVFGLLHGFGFAGALTQLGLPSGHIPLALLFFNAGVEAGQLLFVLVVLGATVLLARFVPASSRWTRQAGAYAIGTVAMFWVMQRVSAI